VHDALDEGCGARCVGEDFVPIGEREVRREHWSKPVSEHALGKWYDHFSADSKCLPEGPTRAPSSHNRGVAPRFGFTLAEGASRCQSTLWESGNTTWPPTQKTSRRAPRGPRTRKAKPATTLLRRTKPAENAHRSTKAAPQTHISRRAPRPQAHTIQSSP
jgi:hypothetical protein